MHPNTRHAQHKHYRRSVVLHVAAYVLYERAIRLNEWIFGGRVEAREINSGREKEKK
jgi:hypothetical protein